MNNNSIPTNINSTNIILEQYRLQFNNNNNNYNLYPMIQKVDDEIILSNLNIYIDYINTNLKQYDLINLYSNDILSTSLISLPKPYIYNCGDNITNIINSIIEFDFTTFYVSILLEFTTIFNINIGVTNELYNMLQQLYINKNNGCKVSKKLLVTSTGLLNSSKINGNLLYNPTVYYIMIYISNVIIRSFINYIKYINNNMVQYYSRTDSVFCNNITDIDTTNIISYINSQFKFIKIHYTSHPKIIINNNNMIYKLEDKLITKLTLGSVKLSDKLYNVLCNYYDNDVINIDCVIYNDDDE